ncbi:MAG: GNAT family N-acetyltransferase [Myxococcota bacterium]|nr:GNAT family N-acetyltransferase [Myxococcota bacterium]
MALPIDESKSGAKPGPQVRTGAAARRNEVAQPQSAQQFFARPAARLEVSELRGLHRLEALGGEWSELLEGIPHEVFSRPELVSAWIRSFAGSGAVRTLVARDAQGKLAAVLPLVEARASELGGVRALCAPGNVHSCRFDFAARDPSAAAGAFMAHLGRDSSWQVLRLTNVAEGAACWNLLFAAEAGNHPIGTWTANRSRHLTLPATVEELRTRLDPTLLANLRRRRRRLAESGEVSLEHFTGGADLDQRLDELFRVEASGWKGREGTAITLDVKTRAFYRDLCHAASRGGYLSLHFLRLNGAAIAADLALAYRGRFLSLKIAYDEALARFGPGQLLTEDMLRHAITQGLTEYDLLGDDAPYKAAWADQVRPHHWLYIFARTTTGRALCSAKFKFAPMVKRLLARV